VSVVAIHQNNRIVSVKVSVSNLWFANFGDSQPYVFIEQKPGFPHFITAHTGANDHRHLRSFNGLNISAAQINTRKREARAYPIKGHLMAVRYSLQFII